MSFKRSFKYSSISVAVLSVLTTISAIADVHYDEQKKEGAGNNSYAVSPKFGVIYSPASNGSIYVNDAKSFTPKDS